MKPFVAVYMVVLTCGLTHSYPGYGSKRFNKANLAEPLLPLYMQPPQQQYYDKTVNSNYQQPQYLSLPYPQTARIADDYNYNSRNPSPSYYYYPREDYPSELYGTPQYRGDYQPKPYYFAQQYDRPSENHLETTNPLDYLHEEILQENERERSMNNAAFMQNLALYNKQVDSLHARQQQLQQFQDLYNLKSSNDPDDYEMEQQPTDWYDQTSIIMDPSTYESFNNDYQQLSQAPSYQYQYQARPSDYEDEVVKELQDLTKQHRKSGKDQVFASSSKDAYNRQDWQQDMPSESDEVIEPEYEDEEDAFINWGGQKRNVQPKKDYGLEDDKQVHQTSVNKLSDVKTSKPSVSTENPISSTENSKLLSKLHRGQKEVVLPRPAAPVRKPFTDPIMKMMKANSKADGKPRASEQQTLPIYKTIKQIIDMEQNLSHVSTTQFSE